MKDDSTDSLPRGWARVPLSEVTIEKVDQAGPKSGVQAFDYIDISSVDNETKVIGSPKRMEPKDAPSRAKQNLRADDILVSMTRPNLNAVSIVPAKLAGAIGSTGFDVLRATDAVDPGWLFMVVRSAKFVDAMTERVQGALYPAVRPRDIRAFEIPLPPLPEQRRIVAKVEAVLARVNAARQRLGRVPALLKRFRQSVLAAACSGRLTADWRRHEGLIDESEEKPALWKERCLSDLCTEFNYGTSAKSSKEGLVPVLRMGNLQDGKLDWTDLAFTSDADEIDKYALHPNTVLFNRTNSPELVGKTALYRGERPAVFAGYLIRVVHGPELDPHFLNFALNAPIFRDYCASVKTDGVSQSNINAKKLAAYPLSWCPLPEQREIVRQVEALFALADKIEARVTASTTRADKLIQATLAKAFRGELVPTEAELAELEGREFETARELLDRIYDERNHVAPTPGRNGSRRSASVARKAELRIK